MVKIVLSGGGTLGPVVPLLAIADTYRQANPAVNFIWFGTAQGPERDLVVGKGIPFFVLGSGKWRRYISALNLFDLGRIAVALVKSLWWLWREKPDLLISAGGFVSVPLHWAGWLLGIPAWVHQQDVRIGLANRFIFWAAERVTTALSDTASKLAAYKAEWLGNPTRELVAAPARVAEWRASLGIPPGAPVIFALGGGTGSHRVNQLVLEALPHWRADWHVIHLVGRERPRELMERAVKVFPNYHVFTFFQNEMALAYALANVVIGRAGFGTLAELAMFKKPAVIIPQAGTHQEVNVRYLVERHAIFTLDERVDDGLKLSQVVRALVERRELGAELGNRLAAVLPRARPERLVAIINELVRS